jgi:hypothetical protein
MKAIKLLPLLLLFVLALVAQFEEFDFDKNVDFSQYKTYAS